MRFRLVQGGYGSMQTVEFPPPGFATGAHPAKFTIVTTTPPRLHAPRISFHRETDAVAPQAVSTDNDWQWKDQTAGLNQAGQGFAPFEDGRDNVPTLYLGFDGGLPAGTIGVAFEFRQDADGNVETVSRVPLEWQFNAGPTDDGWQTLQVKDGTAELTRPGIVQFTWPDLNENPLVPFQSASGNSVSIAPGTFAPRADGTAVSPALAYPAESSFLVRDPDGSESCAGRACHARGMAAQPTALARHTNRGNRATSGPYE